MNNKPLRTVEDILPHLKYIRNKKQEYLVCLSLDGQLRLIAKRTITIGLVDRVLVHPREVYAKAITDRACCIIIAHNHPSGEAKPSGGDIELTQQLVAAGQFLGVPLREHVIVTRDG